MKSVVLSGPRSSSEIAGSLNRAATIGEELSKWLSQHPKIDVKWAMQSETEDWVTITLLYEARSAKKKATKSA